MRVARGVVLCGKDGRAHVYGSEVELEAEEAKAALAAGLVEELEPKA